MTDYSKQPDSTARTEGHSVDGEQTMRVLVVEDHEKVAKFIVKGLREEGYAVDHVNHGNDVLPAVQTDQYDLIVLDVMLPGRDGFEIVHDLRRYKLTLPVLMLTARDQLEDKVAGLDAGADDYLTKPFAFAELSARVRALLRRAESGQVENRLVLADLDMDLAAHEVYRDGQKLDLTSKEFSLLEFLLRQQGRVVTRTAIIEHVWDMHFDSDTNVVDVYIRYLRRKVDEGFEPKLIHTVRGVGYVLKVDE